MTISDSERFFMESATRNEPKSGNGKWRTENGDYTAATTMAATIIDKYGVQVWEKRHLAHGLIARPDLIELLRATPMDDKRTTDRAVKDALVMSKKDEKANLGTAFHSYVQAVFERRMPIESIPESFGAAVRAFFAEMERYNLVLVSCEQEIVNERARSAGRYDFVVQHRTLGWFAIMDVKTGADISRGAPEFAQQLAIYNHAESWETAMPLCAMRQDIALIAHVSVEFGTCDVSQVDTDAGWAAVMLALRVRAYRNRSDLLLPYHDESMPLPTFAQQAPPVPTPVEQSAAEVARIVTELESQPLPSAQPAPEQVIDFQDPGVMQRFQQANPTTINQEFPPAPVVIENGQGGGITLHTVDIANRPTAVVSPQGNVVQLGVVPDDPAPTPQAQQADIDRLMTLFKGKPAMQAAAKVVGDDIKLNAYRINIATSMVRHDNWAAVRSQLLTEFGAGTTVPSPIATGAPLSPQAQQITDNVAQIREGQVITPGATPEPPPVAPPAPPVPAHLSTEQDYLDAIAAALDQPVLAHLWHEAHTSGIGWSARMQAAATAKVSTFS